MMLRSILAWLGFAEASESHSHDHRGGHDRERDHGHTHGVLDPAIATTAQGIWAIKWSFAVLAVTAVLQLVVVAASSSVALLADTIHNVGDALTAVPLWIAFLLARRKPSARFTYGYGRAEDLAGVTIVLIILSSALVAGYQAIDRLIHPKAIEFLGWVALAGVVGFLGNEAVAVLRIRVGRRINSAALVADGYHARTDGLTSLAVVIGAGGVWLGYPLADPLVGLLITLAILGIVWQSGKTVFARMLDGVEPAITDEIRHAAEHVPEVRRVLDVRARWLGHRLSAELDLALEGNVTLTEADAIATRFERELFRHVPALSAARIRARPSDAGDDHRHAPRPVALRGELAEGVIEIVDTPQGERLTFAATRAVEDLEATVSISRDAGRTESLSLAASRAEPARFVSATAPEEPHEFDAEIHLRAGARTEVLPFRLVEPEGHRH